MNQFPPSPRVFHLDRFKFFGDIRESRCTIGINDTGGKFATGISDTGGNFSTIFASVVDTGGKFATGVNDTGGKFAPGVNDAGGKLPPVSTVANNGNNIRLQTP
jgi:hypothetical protein